MKKATFALKVLEDNLLPQLISLLKDVYVSDDSAYMKIMLNFDTCFNLSKKQIHEMVKYIEQLSLGFKACLQKKKSLRQTEELKCQIGTNTEGADIANKMTGLEYSLETITMLTNIIISNDAIERFFKMYGSRIYNYGSHTRENTCGNNIW